MDLKFTSRSLRFLQSGSKPIKADQGESRLLKVSGSEPRRREGTGVAMPTDGNSMYPEEVSDLNHMHSKPRKLILRNHQSPGDLVMLTAAVRDLHRTFPGQFLTDVRTACGALWEN